MKYTDDDDCASYETTSSTSTAQAQEGVFASAMRAIKPRRTRQVIITDNRSCASYETSGSTSTTQALDRFIPPKKPARKPKSTKKGQYQYPADDYSCTSYETSCSTSTTQARGEFLSKMKRPTKPRNRSQCISSSSSYETTGSTSTAQAQGLFAKEPRKPKRMSKSSCIDDNSCHSYKSSASTSTTQAQGLFTAKPKFNLKAKQRADCNSQASYETSSISSTTKTRGSYVVSSKQPTLTNPKRPFKTNQHTDNDCASHETSGSTSITQARGGKLSKPEIILKKSQYQACDEDASKSAFVLKRLSKKNQHTDNDCASHETSGSTSITQARGGKVIKPKIILKESRYQACDEDASKPASVLKRPSKKNQHTDNNCTSYETSGSTSITQAQGRKLSKPKSILKKSHYEANDADASKSSSTQPLGLFVLKRPSKKNQHTENDCASHEISGSASITQARGGKVIKPESILKKSQYEYEKKYEACDADASKSSSQTLGLFGAIELALFGAEGERSSEPEITSTKKEEHQSGDADDGGSFSTWDTYNSTNASTITTTNAADGTTYTTYDSLNSKNCASAANTTDGSATYTSSSTYSTAPTYDKIAESLPRHMLSTYYESQYSRIEEDEYEDEDDRDDYDSQMENTWVKQLNPDVHGDGRLKDWSAYFQAPTDRKGDGDDEETHIYKRKVAEWNANYKGKQKKDGEIDIELPCISLPTNCTTSLGEFIDFFRLRDNDLRTFSSELKDTKVKPIMEQEAPRVLLWKDGVKIGDTKVNLYI